MSRLLLINRRPEQRRVAFIDNGVTTELFFERLKDHSPVGHIYKGRVVRVLPGMQAAFVEVGLQRTTFLYVADLPGVGDDEDGPVGRRGADTFPPIQSLLRNGQQILVQVTKMPVGTKGARVSGNISLPGRHVVYMPMHSHVGVSRRIEDADERERLKAIAEKLKPEEGGLIVRTAGAGLDEAAIAEDIQFLVRLWDDIRQRALMTTAPALVYEDLDLTLRSVRDLLSAEDDRVVVDDDQELNRILSFVRRFMPEFEQNISRWDSPEPMFERYGVEWEITRASRRKVWLKSGGYILIDRTEALCAIDVNTGRFVGKRSFEDTILAINMEAVREIAYQLRLRDIGGIIVIDFIDMQQAANRDKVAEALRDALAEDRAHTRVLPISPLGLIEMTRKRVRNSIVQALTEPCFYCEGKGYLRSLGVICDSIFFTLHQKLRGCTERVAELCAHPKVIEALVHDWERELEHVETLYDVELDLVVAREMHLEWFEIRLGSRDAPREDWRALSLPPELQDDDENEEL